MTSKIDDDVESRWAFDSLKLDMWTLDRVPVGLKTLLTQDVASGFSFLLTRNNLSHGVGRVVGALGSEAGFAGSMLSWVISMMHVLRYHNQVPDTAFLFRAAALFSVICYPLRGTNVYKIRNLL